MRAVSSPTHPGRSSRLALFAVVACLGGSAVHAAQTPPPTAPAAAVPEPIWRLPGSARSMRVDGEDGIVTLPVFVPAASVAGIKRFQLAYKAAISVMPEASWLTLEVNGRTVGRVPIASPNKTKILSFDLPADALSNGWNAVRIGVSQRHRVDCSIAATYELWTEIDPDRSGFVGPLPVIASLDDLPAVPVDKSGVTRLHVLMPPGAGSDDFSRMFRVVERVALRGRFVHPVVDTQAGAAGLELVVGTAAQLATLPAAAASPGTGLRLAAGATGVPRLVISASTDADLDRAIADLGPRPDPIGTPDGLKALASSEGIAVRPGETVTLADAGVPSNGFSGRLYRSRFDVVLPPDAYLADYAEARLSFDGGYAAGLTRDAALVVRVNGVIDGVLGLDRSGGATLQDQTIHMPLTAFRPGRNRIEIEAQVPARSDLECDTLASIGAKERFLILGTSRLSIPPLARIAQFPGLSSTFVSGFRVTRDTNPDVFMPRATPIMVGAAATLLANAALRGRQPTDAAVVRDRPRGGTGSAIVLATAADVPPGVLTASGIDATAIADAWSVPGRSPSRDVTGSLASTSGPNDRTLLDAWGERVEDQRAWYGPLGPAIDWMGEVVGHSLRAAGLLSRPRSTVVVTADTSFVLAQGMLEDTPMTLLVAPDESAMAAGVETMTDPAAAASIEGRAAALTTGADGIDIVAADDTAFFRTQPFSIENDRLIAAGWLSNHAAWYIGAVLLITLLLGASTWAALFYSRREA